MSLENITPEILVENIHKYLAQNISLEKIRTSAFQQGITEDVWNKAMHLLNNPSSEQDSNKTENSTNKKPIIKAIVYLIIILSLTSFFFIYDRLKKGAEATKALATVQTVKTIIQTENATNWENDKYVYDESKLNALLSKNNYSLKTSSQLQRYYYCYDQKNNGKGEDNQFLFFTFSGQIRSGGNIKIEDESGLPADQPSSFYKEKLGIKEGKCFEINP